ncbi:uncharacterized protein [Clytia hemisphaerica]
MNRIRNADWKDDLLLKSRLDELVTRTYKRAEILVVVKKEFSQYSWSLSSLRDRLKHFTIKCTNTNANIDDVIEAVSNELEGPGSKLGYRSMSQKIREVHSLKVPRDMVYEVMKELDPEGLESRGGVGIPKRRRRNRRFISPGSNYCFSLDGHDKLCGYQKSTFPLCIYGGQDTFSGKIMFLKIWTSNNDPMVTGYHYLEYLIENKELPYSLRVDRGTETDTLTAIHCRLHELAGTHGDLDTIVEECVKYGPSTANKIERWWRELHHRLGTFFKEQLAYLLEYGHYDQTDQLDRDMLAFVYIPVIQRELDVFRETVWNHQRGRKQENKSLPTGIPEFIHEHPEEFESENFKTLLNDDQLTIVADETSVLDLPDYIEENRKQSFETILGVVDNIKPENASEEFIKLKRDYLAQFNELW